MNIDEFHIDFNLLRWFVWDEKNSSLNLDVNRSKVAEYLIVIKNKKAKRTFEL